MRGHHHHHHHGRLLNHGDLRYVILLLLDEKPRHGYELIKALEELSSGAYTPSPGAIYPTLTFLDEGGFATSTLEQNKKSYAITTEGRALLNQNREFLESLLKRFTEAGEQRSRHKHIVGREEVEDVAREEASPIRKSMHLLKSELFRFLDANHKQKQLVADILARAAEDIRQLKG